MAFILDWMYPCNDTVDRAVEVHRIRQDIALVKRAISKLETAQATTGLDRARWLLADLERQLRLYGDDADAEKMKQD